MRDHSKNIIYLINDYVGRTRESAPQRIRRTTKNESDGGPETKIDDTRATPAVTALARAPGARRGEAEGEAPGPLSQRWRTGTVTPPPEDPPPPPSTTSLAD